MNPVVNPISNLLLLMNGNGGSADRLGLVIANTTIVLTEPQVAVSITAAPNQLFIHGLYYRNGHTYLAYAIKRVSYMRPFLIVNFEGLGLDRPIAINRGNDQDAHCRPAATFVNDKMHVVVEEFHSGTDDDLWIHKANYPEDVYSFKLQPETIGTVQQYPKIFKFQDGTYGVLGQALNGSDPGIQRGDSNFQNWSDDIRWASSAYPTMPNNADYHVDKSGWLYWSFTDRVPDDRWTKRRIVKTKDGVTHYTFDGGYHQNVPIAEGAQEDTFNFFNPGNDGYQTVGYIDKNENFYSTAHDTPNSRYVLITWFAGEASPTINTVLSDFYVDEGVQHVLLDQQSAIPYTLVINENDIRCFIRRNPTGRVTIYQYKTTDRGLTWTNLGDVFPDVLVDLGRFGVPQNDLDIPNNKNFFIVATEMLDIQTGSSGLYIKKCAFGELQSETESLYNVTPFDFAGFNAISGLIRSYWAEDAYITRSGANITALIDQSVSGKNATAVGSPQYNITDGEFISLNGTNQAFNIAFITDLLACTEGVVFVVAKKDTSVNQSGFWLNATNTGDSIVALNIGATKQAGFFNTSMLHRNRLSSGGGNFTTHGDTAIGSAWHVFAYMFSDGVCCQMWMDGVKQFFNVVEGSPDNRYDRSGYFFNSVPGLNSVDIGRRVNTATTFYDFKMKHMSIFNRTLTFEEIKKITKFLSNRYSIAITDYLIKQS